MKERLDELLEIRSTDYNACFSTIEHSLLFDAPPSAELRLHYVRPDASGEPRFRHLAHVLAKYITVYCFTAERRRDLPELERNELFMQARNLFRDDGTSGQAGELLIYFLLETVLDAPQALKKMPMTTNPREERKGSDGVHFRWDEGHEILDVIFAESKLHQTFSSALASAFTSIETFHASPTRLHEINAFTSAFSTMDPELQSKIVTYIEGENATNCRFVQACLLGFDWTEYRCLDDSRRNDFVKEFQTRYHSWVTGVADSLNARLRGLSKKSLHFELFFVPFKDVAQFRAWFNEELSGRP